MTSTLRTRRLMKKDYSRPLFYHFATCWHYTGLSLALVQTLRLSVSEIRIHFQGKKLRINSFHWKVFQLKALYLLNKANVVSVKRDMLVHPLPVIGFLLKAFIIHTGTSKSKSLKSSQFLRDWYFSLRISSNDVIIQ